ncbi:MAG TPA: glycoside hydrolase family 30 beta sandwich domain-containing protein [Solirubrobacteraceae bacterium]|nr:glycoside hydrolase family 30 beta sandwich domain-containing protein [Solirubrobacteraceae bacterium]
MLLKLGVRRGLAGLTVSLCALAASALTSVARASAAPATVATVRVQVVQTDPNLARAALTLEPSRSFTTQRLPRGVHVIDVDDHIAYQTMLGFGAAMTDSATWLIHNALGPGGRRNVLDQLFSPTDGLGLNFVRVPIGASDFTAAGQPYTYDDVAPGQSDPSLTDFSIAHDLAYVIPTLQQMLKANPSIDIMSTEWTAPAWMKANDSLDDVGRRGTLFAADYPSLAVYLAKFIQAYAAAGIPVWGITPENEPGTPVGYPSMNLSPSGEAQFIAADLAPMFARLGITTRIYGGDIGGRSPAWATAVQSDPAAAAVASGEAWHCYGGQQGMSDFRNRYPAVQELMTECSPGIIPYTGAEAVIDAVRNWASAADLWNAALDPDGGPVQPPNQGCRACTGLLTINESTHTVQRTLNYYGLGQISEFVQRGAVRIATPRWVHDFRDSHGYHVSEGLDNVAFLNPNGSRVLVAYNHSPAPITFGVSWNYRQFAYTLPAGATVTFRWTGAEPRAPRVPADRCLNAGVRYVATPSGLSAAPACG